MILYLIILILISFIGVRFSHFHNDYLSKESTNAIKGFFAILILLSHMKGYVHLSSCSYDTYFLRIMNYIGQMMVAPFLFYSGFGIMESFKKNPVYSKSFPKKRLLKTLLHFDLAVLLFILVQTPVGLTYPLFSYLTCWIGWESVGNSNWFIFDILALYLIAYLGMLINEWFSKRSVNCGIVFGGISIIFCSVILYVLLFFAKRDQSWWVDTLFTFPLGIVVSYKKEEIQKVLRSPMAYWSSLLLLSIFFILWHGRFGVDFLGVSSVVFTIILVLVSIKVRIGNPILNWLGVNAFSIYILQRLPMNILAYFHFNERPGVFSIVSIIVILALAFGFTEFLKWFDMHLFRATH